MNIKAYKEFLGWHLFFPIRFFAEMWLKRRRLVVIYRVFGTGLGDFFAISTVLKNLNKDQGVMGVVFSKKPELFEGNPKVFLNLNYNNMPLLGRSLLKTLLKYLRGSCVYCVGREEWVLGTRPWQATITHRGYLESLLQDVSDRFHAWSQITPEIFFCDDETTTYARKFSYLPANYCLVKATVGGGRTSGVSLKNWNVQNFQAVIDASVSDGLRWVQVGDANEPLLDGVIDLRGRTSIRELAYLISMSKLILTVEGFVSHLVAAFGRPGVVVFTGWNDPGNFALGRAAAVRASIMPECAPCALPHCIKEEQICAKSLSVEEVVVAVRSQLRG